MRTRRTFLTGAAAMTVSLGCAGFALPDVAWVRRRERPASMEPVPREGTLRVVDEWFGGLLRRYTVYLPSSWMSGAALPLVVVAHGSQGNGSTMYRNRGWAAVCERQGWVGVFPDTGAQIVEADPDAAFFLHVLDRMVAAYGTDRRRTWIVGFSGGGKRAYNVAAQHSDRIAAVAVHSGKIAHREDDPATWDPRRADLSPLAVLHLHGARDDRVPPNGGIHVPPDHVPRHVIPMAEALATWAEALHAVPATPPRIPEVPDDCALTLYEAPAGRAVLGVLDPELGHEWAPYANDLIVRFLERMPPKDA